RSYVESSCTNILRVIELIDRYADSDGDVFVEYARKAKHGLIHQGWKDSHDAIFHRDGTSAEGPIALCEVQGYVYAAKTAAGELAKVLGHAARARAVSEQGEARCRRFEGGSWCTDASTY